MKLSVKELRELESMNKKKKGNIREMLIKALDQLQRKSSIHFEKQFRVA